MPNGNNVYPFAFRGEECAVKLDTDKGTLSFSSQVPGATGAVPTVAYDLHVDNGMLVGTTPGFTSIVVFSEQPGVPPPPPLTCQQCEEDGQTCGTKDGQVICIGHAR